MILLKKLILEGRYDSLVTKLSNTLLSVIKDSYSAVTDKSGKFASVKIHYKVDDSYPDIQSQDQDHVYFEEIENETIPLDFYLILKVQWIDNFGEMKSGGDAFNDTSKNAADPPLIEVRFEIDPTLYPKVLNNISMELRDILRHELEHLTQSGWNVINSKYIPSDQSIRKKIESGKMQPYKYFILPKEIPAMIHGLYMKAKKSKTPFKQVVDEYLNGWISNNTITDAEKQQILTTWRTYLPKLSIRQEL